MATRSRDVLVAQTPSWRAKARHPRLFLAACGKVVGGGPSPATTLNGRPGETGSDFRRGVLGGASGLRYLPAPAMDIPIHPDTALGPLPAYRALRAAGRLLPDAAQERAMQRLQTLWLHLRAPDPPPRPPPAGRLARLLRQLSPEAPEKPPSGLYLVGEVGR